MKKNQEEKYKINIVQKALFYDAKTKKFLLLKSKEKSEYYLELFGWWEIPGGKLDEKESMEEGLAREIREELGDIKFNILCPVNTRKIKFEDNERVIIDYLVEYIEGEVCLSDEHDECRWLTTEEIEKSDEYKPWVKKLTKAAEEKAKTREYLDSLKRCQADFENYKKRQAQNHKEMIEFSNINLVTQIIPVLDNFHASTDHIPEKEKESPWVTGIMHIQRQLDMVLQDNGVKEIELKTGDKFDPATMEAIDNKDCPPEKCKNIVKKVVMKGYKMGERVIRAARVIVE